MNSFVEKEEVEVASFESCMILFSASKPSGLEVLNVQLGWGHGLKTRFQTLYQPMLKPLVIGLMISVLD